MSAAPPTAEQLAAISVRESDVFCEAGAGTGKTRVLVDRYCEAVAADRVPVERILAFTFTERAAGELRTRVRRQLSERARSARVAGDRGTAEALGRAARATERAWVMTIHAFCLRLLASHPLAAGIDPRFRVLEEAEATRLRERAAAEALDALLEAGDEDVAHAAAAYQPWRIGRMAVSAHERLRSHGMADPRLPAVPDPAHSPRSSEERRSLTPAEARAARRARAALERLLEGFHTRYEALKEARSALDFGDLELRALALLRTSPAIAASWSGRFTHLMVDEFQDTNRAQLELVEALRGPATRLFTVGDENQSIYRFRNADLQVFREQRARAREDAPTALPALRGNFRSRPGALAAVNAVGRALLRGFVELTAGREPSRDSEDDRAGAAGGASAELLLTLDEGRARDARKWATEGIDLDPPPGGAPAAAVAEARFLAERLRELVDSGEAERGEIVVLLRAFTHVDAYEEALGRAGLRPYVVGGRGYWTQQQVEDLVRLLGAVSNPLDDERLFGALASFAAGVSPDALWLLRRAAGEDAGGRPRHVWPLVAWRFGGGEREPAGADGAWLDAIPPADAERLRRFCRILAPLRAEAPLLSLEALIERTMTAFDYDLGLLSRPGGAGRMANVRKLMRLARGFERTDGRDLAGFLRLAGESTRRDEREGMAALRAEGHDGVRVMTVHAAKGLEFPIVAVPDLGRSLSAGHSWDDVVIARDGASEGAARFGMRLSFATSESLGLWELAELSEGERDAEVEECCRLVYVAASRAMERLVLSGVYRPADLEPPEERGPADSALRRLLPSLAAHGWEGGPGAVELPAPAPAGGGAPPRERHTLEVRVSEPSPERAAELARRRPPPPEPDPLEGTPASPPLLERLPHAVPAGHLSYSALGEYERCPYRFYVERVLGGREAPAGVSPSLAFGNAVHALLERSAREGWRAPDPGHVDAALRCEGLRDPEQAARAAAMAGRWLGSGLCRELAEAGARLHPEAAFLLPLAGTVVRGKIDLLAELPGGELLVVDYKTDSLAGGDPGAHVSRYETQRSLYALAAAEGFAAREGGGRRPRAVRTAYAFLDADGPAVERAYDERALAGARAELERLAGGIRSGAFAVTDRPHHGLCFDCPARARLCSHSWERTGEGERHH